MADEVKRAQSQIEGAAQQTKQATDIEALQEQFANFYTELAKQMQAFRAPSSDQTDDSDGSDQDGSGSDASAGGSRARPGAPGENRANRGRTSLITTIAQELAKDIQSGGPLARSIQLTYGIGRSPTQR
jgi:hypothetical protein